MTVLHHRKRLYVAHAVASKHHRYFQVKRYEVFQYAFNSAKSLKGITRIIGIVTNTLTFTIVSKLRCLNDCFTTHLCPGGLHIIDVCYAREAIGR